MRIIIVLLLVCVAVPASAQDTATLIGTVTDITGGVLDDARLEVAGPVRRTAVTGSDGTFRISALPLGTYRVTTEREGFSTYEEVVLLDSPQRELSIELPLSPFTQFVETVSRVVEERARAPFLVTVVDGEEIEETGAATLDEALRTVCRPAAWNPGQRLHAGGDPRPARHAGRAGPDRRGAPSPTERQCGPDYGAGADARRRRVRQGRHLGGLRTRCGGWRHAVLHGAGGLGRPRGGSHLPRRELRHARGPGRGQPSV